MSGVRGFICVAEERKFLSHKLRLKSQTALLVPFDDGSLQPVVARLLLRRSSAGDISRPVKSTAGLRQLLGFWSTKSMKV